MTARSARDRPQWTDRVLELDVGSPAHGGHCVARHEGRVVFVRHALPGERVRAVVIQDGGGSFCRAEAIAVLDASPRRVAPPCPWARAGGCGGCDLQHVAPAAQRAWKAGVVAEQLRRLAGLDVPVTVEELPGGVLGWRSRVRLGVGTDGRAGLRAHRSHDVLPIGRCPITVAGALEEVLAGRWRPGSELEVVADDAGEVHVAELASGGGRRRQASGSGVAQQRAAGRTWRVSASGFWQVHPAAAEALAGVVAQWAQAPASGLAWDLYGGAGLFSAVLAEAVGPTGTVVLVESSRPAVADAVANLTDLPQVHVRAGRVERLLTSLPGPPDVVVTDPPRRGLGAELVRTLAAVKPGRVVCVACDPAALARDVAAFAAVGYRLAGLRAFDAFPMTHHVECAALLVSG